MPRIRIPLRCGVIVAALLVACSSGASNDPVEHPSSDVGTLEPADPIPSPTGEVILRIGGAVSNTNGGDRILLDLETLEELPLTTVSIPEPFIGRDVEFTGVSVDNLMEVAGAEASASSITMTALDDYVIDIPMDLVRAESVLLATQADGAPIAIADGGPIRIIFLGESDFELNTDNWIWSVARMKVVA